MFVCIFGDRKHFIKAGTLDEAKLVAVRLFGQTASALPLSPNDAGPVNGHPVYEFVACEGGFKVRTS